MNSLQRWHGTGVARGDVIDLFAVEFNDIV